MTGLDTTRLPQTDAISADDFRWIVDAYLNRWSGNSQSSYALDLSIYFDWCTDQGIDPFHARRIQIEAFIRHLTDTRKNSPRSIQRRIVTLRQFYEYAIDDDLATKNPCKNVKVARPKLDLSKKVHLNREETQRFLRAAYDTSKSEYAMCVLMAYLGLRVTEACELNVPDVMHYSKGHRVLVFVGKNGDPATVPQPPVVMRALENVIESLDDKLGPLFVRRDGSRMTRRSADRVVKRIAKRAGITDMVVSPHTLRHGAIANAIDAGIPLRDVQLMARHRDISTTIRIYDRGRFNLDTHASHGLAAYLGAVG